VAVAVADPAEVAAPAWLTPEEMLSFEADQEPDPVLSANRFTVVMVRSQAVGLVADTSVQEPPEEEATPR
jgi:hypothetical protein